VLLPLVLLIPAIAFVLIAAFGVHPGWCQFHWGLQIILLTRRLEWPLVSLSILLCLILISQVVAGKTRAWWLLGLAPVLAILAHHFSPSAAETFRVNTDPTFITPDQATFLSPDDWVVGLTDSDGPVAYPYACLYSYPLVIQTQQEKPIVLIWSAFANRALAIHIDRSIKPRDLQIVSIPANTLLIYNTRLGQFISGMTGLTPKNEIPQGFQDSLPVTKTTWHRWLTEHPDTRVLYPPDPDLSAAPTRPLLPAFPTPATALPRNTSVALICATQPSAIPDNTIDSTPRNYSAPPLLVLRDPQTAAAKAYVRQTDEDLFPKFLPDLSHKHLPAIMFDEDSHSFWTPNAQAIAGPLKGQHLTPVPIDDEVDYNSAKFWYPTLPILSPTSAQ
jgi:hypothetical protein